jgi:hypothetical protein
MMPLMMNLVGGLLERAKVVEFRDPALAADLRKTAELLMKRSEK